MSSQSSVLLSICIKLHIGLTPLFFRLLSPCQIVNKLSYFKYAFLVLQRSNQKNISSRATIYNNLEPEIYYGIRWTLMSRSIYSYKCMAFHDMIWYVIKCFRLCLYGLQMGVEFGTKDKIFLRIFLNILLMLHYNLGYIVRIKLFIYLSSIMTLTHVIC